jgi:hypothetical protein
VKVSYDTLYKNGNVAWDSGNNWAQGTVYSHTDAYAFFSQSTQKWDNPTPDKRRWNICDIYVPKNTSGLKLRIT